MLVDRHEHDVRLVGVPSLAGAHPLGKHLDGDVHRRRAHEVDGGLAAHQEPTGIRSRSHPVDAAVTAGPPACRMAATAAAWSTSAISSPPNKSPRMFCMCGMTKVVMLPTEWAHGA